MSEREGGIVEDQGESTKRNKRIVFVVWVGCHTAVRWGPSR